MHRIPLGFQRESDAQHRIPLYSTRIPILHPPRTLEILGVILHPPQRKPNPVLCLHSSLLSGSSIFIGLPTDDLDVASPPDSKSILRDLFGIKLSEAL